MGSSRERRGQLLDSSQDNNRGAHNYRVIARLKPAVTLEQAQADMNVIAQRLEQQYPDSNTGMGANIVPLQDQISSDPRVHPCCVMILDTRPASKR